MPVTNAYAPIEHLGNGVTTLFAYNFMIFDEAHLVVTVDDVVKTLSTHYTVTGERSQSGGSITFVVAPANAAVVEISRAVPYVRETDYQEGGGFPAGTVDDDQDDQEMQIQQLAYGVSDLYVQLEELRQLIEDLGEVSGGIGSELTLNNLTISNLLTAVEAAITDLTVTNLTVTESFDPPDQSIHVEHLGDDVVQFILNSAGGGGGSGNVVFSGNGRLTLDAASPVMTTDYTAKTEFFDTSTSVFINNGDDTFSAVPVSGLTCDITDTTKSPAAAAADKIYHAIVWDDNGTMRLTRGPAWASDTSEGTGAATAEPLFIQSNIGRIMVNKYDITNGPLAKQGTIRGAIMTDGSGQLKWLMGSNAVGGGQIWLCIDNISNPAGINTCAQNQTVSWSKSTTTVEPFNTPSLGMRCTLVRCLNESFVRALFVAQATPGTSTNTAIALGVDSTSVAAVGQAAASTGQDASMTLGDTTNAMLCNYARAPGKGKHYIQCLQFMTFANNSTYYGGTATGDGGCGLFVDATI